MKGQKGIQGRQVKRKEGKEARGKEGEEIVGEMKYLNILIDTVKMRME